MIPSKLTLKITGITETNKKSKLLKAIKTASKELEIPATIEHKENHKEEFPFQAQQDLFDIYQNKTGLMMDDLYSRLCSTLELRPVNTFRKAIAPNAPTLGKTILWNPETGLPISQKDIDRLLNAVDKFLNRDPLKKEFTLSQSAIARMLANLKKNYTTEELRKKPLDEIKYKNKAWDYFNTYKRLEDAFPANYDRLKFRERVVGNYIQDISEKARKGIRDIVDQGYLAGTTKGEISQQLFDKFGSLNKDWERIIDTESSNIFNSEYIEEELKDAEVGEPVYFIRREFMDSKTCSFCEKATKEPIIARWSDVPLQDDKIKDPVASIAIWSGKSNFSRNNKDWWWAESAIHPHCYSDDTEVLTDNGWKLFKDVLITDKIMSINPDTREIDYLHHNGLISYHYEGKMIHFDGLNYDKLVTPDHNCIYKKSGKGLKFSQGKAKDLIGTDIMMPRAVGLWYGFNHFVDQEAKEAGLDPVFYMKLWGWFLSEGNVRTYGNRCEIKLSQKNPQDIIDDLGDHEILKKGKDAIYIFNRKVVEKFAMFSGVHAEQKYIPRLLKNSSKEYISIFVNSFMLGDGSKRVNTSSNPEFGKSLEKVVRTSSPIMTADLCEMIVKMGLICSVSKQDGKGIPIRHKNGTYVGNTDCYSINILKSKFRHYHKEPKLSKVTNTYSKEIHEVDYSGMVYDVELVKWHFLLVKRNGKLAWSGNCRGFWDRYFPEIGDIEL